MLWCFALVQVKNRKYNASFNDYIMFECDKNLAVSYTMGVDALNFV